MPDKDIFDFDSIFEEDNKATPGRDVEKEEHDFANTASELISLEEMPSLQEKHIQKAEEKPSSQEKSDSKRRSSEDFQPDMDALLITAQSSMIIEALKFMAQHDYSSKRLSVYSEAAKGVDLYLKILKRNPDSYFNLSKVIENDIDCKEVEKTAFNIFRSAKGRSPELPSDKEEAFEKLKERLLIAYNKSYISFSMSEIKKFFLFSGSINEDKLNRYLQQYPENFKNEINKLSISIKLATDLLKSKNPEIAQGLKGKDVNIFIIKACDVLRYYYHITGNRPAEDYFKRVMDNYKKYFVIRD